MCGKHSILPAKIGTRFDIDAAERGRRLIVGFDVRFLRHFQLIQKYCPPHCPATASLVGIEPVR